MSEDLIKREDAIKAIKQWRDNDGSLFDVGLNQAIREIKRLPSADRPQEWIPCSERLPARQGYYICTCKDGSRILKTTTIKWSNGWQLSGTRAYWKVIAWMPLPDPWKGADDE